jgi:ADP-heptose:LPS heptosyltransferase
MIKKDILNYDYLKQIVEIPLLFIVNFKKKKIDAKPKKILIVNTCLIGDITASLSAMRKFIRKKDSITDVIVPSPMKEIIERVKGVNKVYIARSVSERVIEKIKISNQELKELKRNNYDLVLVIRLSKDAYYLLKEVNFKSINSSPISYTKYILHLLRKIIYKGKVKQYRDVNFEWVGEDSEELTFEEIFKINQEDYKKILQFPEMKGNEKKIIIHAASGWQKHWDIKKWVELVKKINKLGNYKFIFIGGSKEEQEDFEKIKKKIPFKVCSLIKKVNLLELLLIMRVSNYFIGIDSGPRNMAHLADLRSVSLIGPGPKHFMPLNNKDIVVDKSKCHCTQLFCFKGGICMKEICVSDVYEGFKKLIAKK